VVRVTGYNSIPAALHHLSVLSRSKTYTKPALILTISGFFCFLPFIPIYCNIQSKDLLRLREEAVKDSKWSAAVAAEMGRGKAAGLYVNKVDSDDDKNLTVEIVRFGDT
jgi:hypothetical protein